MLQVNAKEILMNHAGLVEGPWLTTGLLGMLRPYQGILEVNLHEVIGCLHSLSPELRKENIDREIVLAVLMINANLNSQAINPSGALRRNKLLKDIDLKRLEMWSVVIETASVRYFSKFGDSLALGYYLQYLASYDVGEHLNVICAEAAIADSLRQDGSYQLAATQVCLKYPAIGRRFREKAELLLSAAPPEDELRDKLLELINLAD